MELSCIIVQGVEHTDDWRKNIRYWVLRLTLTLPSSRLNPQFFSVTFWKSLPVGAVELETYVSRSTPRIMSQRSTVVWGYERLLDSRGSWLWYLFSFLLYSRKCTGIIQYINHIYRSIVEPPIATIFLKRPCFCSKLDERNVRGTVSKYLRNYIIVLATFAWTSVVCCRFWDLPRFAPCYDIRYWRTR